MGGMGGMSQQNPWGQGGSSAPNPFSPFPQQSQGGLNASRAGSFGDGLQQTPLAPKRPFYAAINKSSPRLLFAVAGLFVVLAAILLGLVYALGSSHSGNNSSNTASTAPNTPTSATATPVAATPTAASSTPDATPTPDGTAYPAQQYIDNAQMAESVDKATLEPKNPTTTFKVGSSMYVVFHLHPPSQGGAVCSYWYLGGKQVTSYPFSVKGTQQASYTFATYGSPGDAYVDLYWASSKSCSDKVLAQHVTFTVTA